MALKDMPKGFNDLDGPDRQDWVPFWVGFAVGCVCGALGFVILDFFI